jgi:hypothetical protein
MAGLSVTHFQLKHVFQYSGDHSLVESPKTTQQCYDRHDSRCKAPAWQGRWQLPLTSLPTVQTRKRMRLLFPRNRLNMGQFRNLKAFGSRVDTVELRTKKRCTPQYGNTSSGHTLRSQSASKLSKFAKPALSLEAGLRDCRADWPLYQTVVRRSQRRIPRVHLKEEFYFLESLSLIKKQTRIAGSLCSPASCEMHSELTSDPSLTRQESQESQTHKTPILRTVIKKNSCERTLQR